MATITITVQLSGETSWVAQDIEGLDALGKMAETLVDMYDYFYMNAARPELDIEPSRVCIEFDGNNIHIAYRPEGDDVAAKGLIAAALVGLHRASQQEGFDPLQSLLGAIKLEAGGS